MHRIELSYNFSTDRDHAAPIRNPLMDLLFAVREHGSISAAASSLGLSYRHVWGELKKWEKNLGQPVIVWEKGQAARLNDFGNKLLWAERQAQARLAPQIDALHADLERAFAMAFDEAAHIATLYASHDEALARLREHSILAAKLHLDIHFTGSVDAISALNQGRCVMAGFHVPPQLNQGTHTEHSYKPLLKPGLHKLIGFARRRQGLLVAHGNPLQLSGIESLAQPDIRYVNRALGTGTRVLFDELLANTGLKPSAIQGYGRTEPSHSAVAHAIASGTADAGLGIEVAARAHHIDFIPVVEEEYFLVCLKSALELPATQALLEVLRSPALQAGMAAMPGYTPSRSGSVLSMTRELPWWAFPDRN